MVGGVPIVETLYLYIVVKENSISSMLIKEESMVQKPVYFVSKVMQGPEIRYTKIEKATLAVMTMARKLRPYFPSYVIKVRTNLPCKKTLGRPDLPGRIVK